MKKIAVIAAMEKEAELLDRLQDPRIRVVTSGIGKVAAAVTALRLIEQEHPDLIINTGIAGGLDASLEIGQLVLGRQIAYHDVWCGEPNAVGQVQGFPLYYQSDTTILDCFDPHICRGLIISGDRFISEPEELSRLKQLFPDALAVDMESAAIAQTCHLTQTPFLAVRLISDTPGVEHHAEQYNDFWKNAAARSFETIRNLLKSLSNK